MTKEDKECLSKVVKPCRNEIRCIKKVKDLYRHNDNKEYILIYYVDKTQPKNTLVTVLDDFEEGSRYAGMALDKYYTLEELGL